jgi:hypothetical protein
MTTTYTVSVKEKIVQDVEEALQGISRANGYENNLEVVERWEQDGNSKELVPALFIHSELKSSEELPGLVTRCVVTITIDCWVCHDKTKFAKSSDAYLDTFESDIIKAVMDDYQRSGLAEKTEYSGPAEKFHEQDGAATCGIICRFDVQYKHVTGDPRSQY